MSSIINSSAFVSALLLSLILFSLKTIFVSGATCDDNFDLISGSCFHFNNADKMEWMESRIYCQQLGADLAVIKTCNMFHQIVLHIFGYDYDVPTRFGYWIGGSDEEQEGHWYWIDGTAMQLGIPFWGSYNGTPDPGVNNEEQNCAQMYKPDGFYFHDSDCYGSLYALCQKDAEDEN